MTTQSYGRKVTSPEADRGEIGAGDQRACVYDNLSATLIVYQLGGWLGKSSGSPVARIGVGKTTGSTPDPGALLAYTPEITASATYTDVTGGAAYTGDITPFIAPPGRYSLAIAARNGVLSHSMRQAAAITTLNRNFYDKSGLGSTVPTNPIGGSPSYNGSMSLWMTGMVNVAPDVPINRLPFGTLTNADTTPNLEADFNDANEILPNSVAYDYLTQVGVQLRQVGQTTLKWDTTYSATSSERSAAHSKIEYAGSSLSFGTAYEWRIRHQDRAGAWSDWSTWLSFTLAGAGAVATPTSPTGRQTTKTPGPFVAKWTSQGALSTNAVQVRLLVGGTIVQTSGTISSTVANNANISVSFATAAFASLSWGTPYTYQIRGRDTAGIWSDWSSEQSFYTNSAPNLPNYRTPLDATVVTSLPKLRALCTDPDGDTVTVYFRIKNSSGTVLFTRTGTYNSGTKYFEYQTTSTDCASFATYRWDTYSYDGALYSGEATSAGSASTSAELTFVYATGPVVAVTSPTNAQVFTSRSIPVAWTAATQVKRQIFFYDVNGVQIYASNLVTTAVTTATVLNANIYTGNTYTVVVAVTDVNNIVGTSDPVSFTLTYTPATSVTGLQAYPVTINTDAVPTAILLNWETSQYPASQFLSYDVFRTALDGLGGNAIGDRVHLRTIPAALQTSYLDDTPASGQAYLYEIEQSIQNGLDVLTSVPASAQAQVDFQGIILSNVRNPEAFHVDLRYAASADDEGTWDYVQDLTLVVPTGARASQAIVGTRQEWNPSGTYILLSDDIASADDRLAALKALILNGGTLCIRDGHSEVRFVTCTKVQVKKHRMFYEVALGFNEVGFDLGEDEAA